jgi:alginate O-acetyltransferase complex protein AlgJ
LKPLGEWFPNVKAISRNRFTDTVTMGPGGDLANMMGMTDVYQEEVLGLRPMDQRQAHTVKWSEEQLSALQNRPTMVQESEIPGSRLPRLIMFHDSFGIALLPFFAEHFSRATYVFNPMSLDDLIVDREKPDLVIQEITERYLWGDYAKTYANRP